MAKNRKAAEKFILDYVEKLLPNSPNTEMYKQFFTKMSDKEFDTWIQDIGTGKEMLSIVTPNLAEYQLDIERNMKIADELGHEFFKRVWIKPKNGSPAYLTPNKHLVYMLPLRRQAQLLVKKINIPKDNNTVDIMTGQPTGDSKGGKVSYVELQVLSAMGLENTATEFIKYRGGDDKGFRAMNTLIGRQGKVSQKEAEPYSGGVRSTKVLHALLTAAHLENNL